MFPALKSKFSSVALYCLFGIAIGAGSLFLVGCGDDTTNNRQSITTDGSEKTPEKARGKTAPEAVPNSESNREPDKSTQKKNGQAQETTQGEKLPGGRAPEPAGSEIQKQNQTTNERVIEQLRKSIAVTEEIQLKAVQGNPQGTRLVKRLLKEMRKRLKLTEELID